MLSDENHKPAESANHEEINNRHMCAADEAVPNVENVPLKYPLSTLSPIGTAPKAIEEECLPDGSVIGEEERIMLPGEDPLNAGDGDAITPLHERQNSHQHGNSSEHKSVTTVC